MHRFETVFEQRRRDIEDMINKRCPRLSGGEKETRLRVFLHGVQDVVWEIASKNAPSVTHPPRADASLYSAPPTLTTTARVKRIETGFSCASATSLKYIKVFILIRVSLFGLSSLVPKFYSKPVIYVEFLFVHDYSGVSKISMM